MAGDDWWHNACLNYLSGEWHAYAEGYKEAADALAEHVKENRGLLDLLILPIVFLYRQYLEIRLKQLIKDGRVLLDDVPDFPKTHRLDILWDQCRSVLSRVETIPTQDLTAISEAIGQFCEVDPTSQAFRYPTTRDGQQSLPTGLHYINLRNLADVMQRIGGFFEGAAMMVSVYLDYKREMDWEHRDDFSW
jgi:hypothetical protein